MKLKLSRDKKGVVELAEKKHKIHQSADFVKDPYVLEFTGLWQDDRFREKDLEKRLSDEEEIRFK